MSETRGPQMRGIPAGDETARGERWSGDGPPHAAGGQRPVTGRGLAGQHERVRADFAAEPALSMRELSDIGVARAARAQALADGRAREAPGAAAAAGGDAGEIVTRLYRDNGALVLSYVTGLLRDRHLAEDVVQETMLRAWRHCAQFSAEKGSVRGWLIRVAHNVAMDKIRMRKSRPAEVDADAAPESLADDPADAVVTAVHVRAALARLSGGQRAVLEQVYLNGLTAREAAVRLGIPEGTVSSRCYYALRTLRRELGAAEPDASAGAPGRRAA